MYLCTFAYTHDPVVRNCTASASSYDAYKNNDEEQGNHKPRLPKRFSPQKWLALEFRLCFQPKSIQ